jgi:hypothetical protein
VCLSSLFFLYREPSAGEPWEEEEEEEEKSAAVMKQMVGWWQARAYPDPTYINDKWWAAWQHEQAMRADDLQSRGNSSSQARNYGSWSSIGPNNGPGGRIISLAVKPSDPNTIFAGSASGGIWKSTNGAASWTYVPTNLPVLGVSTILIDPADNEVMYAGTGEVYRVDTSNFGYNVWKARGTYGIGVIKSTDGGVTWRQVLTKSSSLLFGVQKLHFDPTNHLVVYAACTDGLYRSVDSGANWTNIAPGKLYVSDVVINATNTNQVMLAVGNLTNSVKGIYRSTNAQNASPTWTKLTTGLPAATAYQGFTRFAYQGGNNVVASFTNGSGSELRRTTNFGTGWTTLTGSGFASYQYWCTNLVGVFPTRPDSLVLGGVNVYRYRVSSQTLTSINNSGIHADHHDVAFHPTDPNTFYVANDGGVWKTTNGGGSFVESNTGLGATQFYASFGVSTTTANLYVGGLQDNGVWQYSGGSWNKRLGGDGGPSMWVAGTNTVFASLDAREVYRSTNNGSSFSRVTTGTVWRSSADSRTGFMAPIAVAPNGTTVYAGSDNLHVNNSTGASGSWSQDNYSGATNYIDAIHKTAIALAVAPSNSNRVYVSTSSFAQYDNDVDDLYINQPPSVRRTSNGSTGGTPWTTITAGLPNRFIMDFAISPTQPDSVWVAVGGYGSSHIFVSGNGGGTWVDRGAGLPDVPFNAILIDKNNRNYLYAGSDMGVYVSNNYGVTWFAFSGGLPDATQVFDLQLTADNRLLAATHGKGAWITNLATTAALPVNLLEFSGKNKGLRNELKWRVSEEKNLAKYELERKIDNGNFSVVATVNSRNSSIETSYTHTDDISNTSGSNYYYRVRMVDRDGSDRYSNVIVLKVTRPGGMEILGNPVTAGSSIRLTLTNPQHVVFKLFDIKGQLIRMSTVQASAGSSSYPFSMFGVLPAGNYTIQAIAGQERYTKRVIVK